MSTLSGREWIQRSCLLIYLLTYSWERTGSLRRKAGLSGKSHTPKVVGGFFSHAHTLSLRSDSQTRTQTHVSTLQPTTASQHTHSDHLKPGSHLPLFKRIKSFLFFCCSPSLLLSLLPSLLCLLVSSPPLESLLVPLRSLLVTSRSYDSPCSSWVSTRLFSVPRLLQIRPYGLRL